MHKSTGPDEIHPRVLREHADVVSELSITYEKSRSPASNFFLNWGDMDFMD